jgi:photosystem II stability/assembly factor-like uncharacterized protein
MPFQLGQVQFIDALEGWAVGFVVSLSEIHLSQSSTILHTADGGMTWRPLESVETYGVDVEPAFCFIDKQRGWIAWQRPDAEDRLIQTEDRGRRWRNLHARLEGTLVHLQLFDSRLGVAALSTSNGAHFAGTTNGGITWKDQPVDLPYPDVLLFLNRNIGWYGGSRNASFFTPRLFLTNNGGESWREASFPENTHGIPHDLFFVRPEHGWLVLWNAGTRNAGSALLESTDGGETWTVSRVSALVGADRRVNAVRFLSEKVGFVIVGEPLAESEESGILSPSTDNAAVLSTVDGGETWQTLALPAAVQSCQVVGGEVWCTSRMDVLKIRATQ